MRFITHICIVLPPATRDSECVGSSPLRVLCPETQFFLPRPLLLAWPTARPRACLRRRGAAGRCICQRFTVLPHRIITSRLISNVNSRNTSDSTRRFRMRICAYCATPSLGSRVYHSIRTPCNLLGRRRCFHGYARVRDSSGARIWRGFIGLHKNLCAHHTVRKVNGALASGALSKMRPLGWQRLLNA